MIVHHDNVPGPQYRHEDRFTINPGFAIDWAIDDESPRSTRDLQRDTHEMFMLFEAVLRTVIWAETDVKHSIRSGRLRWAGFRDPEDHLDAPGQQRHTSSS
jgi:hypothetical protein